MGAHVEPWNYLMGFTALSNCEACTDNNWMSYHQWQSGAWADGTMRGFDWKAREFVSLNTWGPTVDDEDLNVFVDKAISAKFAKSYLARDVCKMAPTIALLEDVACACGEKRDDCKSDSVKLQRYEAPVFGGKETAIATKDADMKLNFDDTVQAKVFSVPMLNFIKSDDVPTKKPTVAASADELRVLSAAVDACASGKQASEVYYSDSDTGTPAGQLLGNGVLVQVDSETVTSTMKVCLHRSSTITECSDK
jgi:hypothetical protein